jgi:hypothetical protein
MPPIERPYVLEVLSVTGDKRSKTSPLKENGKYFTSLTSILSKSMDARSDFNLFFDFISFKASTIVNHIDEGEGCSGGRWEGEIWITTFLYIRLQGDLATCIGSWEGIKWTLLNGNGDVFERSTDVQMSSSESDSTNIISSRGSTLICAIEGI